MDFARMRWRRFARRLFLALIVVAVSGACAGGARNEREAAMPQKVELARYAGLWYEFARTPNAHQDNTPKRDGRTYSICSNTTATYTQTDDGSLRLRNVCVRTAPDGSTFEDVAEGVANVVAGSEGRKLKIAFGPAIARFFQRLVSFGGFDYWIYALGDAGPSAPYPWAIVSGPDRDFIYFLTREQRPSPVIKEAMVSAARGAGLPVDKLVYMQEGRPAVAVKQH
jgi:apolipoprotein D and lipocalin family protein